jgi:diguanylate cyclase (GGDEF)-like protein
LQLNEGNKKIHITASIGISDIKENSKQAWGASLNNADKALYQAKDNGRNCFVIYSNDS